MKLEEIDHWMTQITDILTNVSGKLNQVGDLNLALGKKLDFTIQAVGRLADLSAQTENRLERLASTVDKFVAAQQDTNRRVDERFERVLTALEKGGNR